MMTCYPVPTFADGVYVRDSEGNLNGPYDSYQEAIADHLDEMGAQANTILSLYDNGYEATHWYTDGIVRMAQGDGDHDLVIFVRTDGTHRKPRTRASMQMAAMLSDEMRHERNSPNAP